MDNEARLSFVDYNTITVRTEASIEPAQDTWLTVKQVYNLITIWLSLLMDNTHGQNWRPKQEP